MPKNQKKKLTQSEVAQKQFDIENSVKKTDEYYKYDEEKQERLLNSHPWRKNPTYFKHVKISGLALLKIVMHAASGGKYEIMGLMQGFLDHETFIITDSFALPVKGTETRVSAGSEAIEFMSKYVDQSSTAGRNENVVGWYHSHPGYGCWLSGIDVNTQRNNQSFQDPFLAVVIDPMRTVASGKVEIQAFRTYPKDYKPSKTTASEYQSIPDDKIEDFGVYASAYYMLQTEFFKSSTDTKLLNLLWNKYWINTLSSSPLLANRSYINGQINDVQKKLSKVSGNGNSSHGFYHSMEVKGEKEESKLSKVNKDSVKLSNEILYGVISQSLKRDLFNCKPRKKKK